MLDLESNGMEDEMRTPTKEQVDEARQWTISGASHDDSRVFMHLMTIHFALRALLALMEESTDTRH